MEIYFSTSLRFPKNCQKYTFTPTRIILSSLFLRSPMFSNSLTVLYALYYPLPSILSLPVMRCASNPLPLSALLSIQALFLGFSQPPVPCRIPTPFRTLRFLHLVVRLLNRLNLVAWV